MGEHAVTRTTDFYARIDFDKKALTKLVDDEGITHLRVRLALPRRNLKDVAKLIAKKPRPHIQHLALIDACYDPSAEIGRAMISGKALASFWAALPNMETLELQGHAFFAALEHPTLTKLVMRGACFGTTGSFTRQPATAPALRSLTWAFTKVLTNELGVSVLRELWDADGLESLSDLNLGRANFNADLFRSKSLMQSALLPQLERLVVPIGSVDEKTLKKALPKLAHLSEVLIDDPNLVDLDERLRLLESEDLPPVHHPEHLIIPDYASDGDIARMGIEHVETLRMIDSQSNDLDASGARAIGELIARHPELEAVSIRDPFIYGITTDGLEALQQALTSHPGITSLDLYKNKLEGSGETLTALLSKLPSLERLNLWQTRLTDSDLEELILATGEHPSIRELRAPARDADALRHWARLRSDSLEQLRVNIKLEGAHALAFTENIGERLPSLERLTVDASQSSPEAFTALTRELTGHPTLQTLRIKFSSDAPRKYAELGDLLARTNITNLTLTDMTPPGETDHGELEALTRAQALEHLGVASLEAHAIERSIAWSKVIEQIPTLHTISEFVVPDSDEDMAGYATIAAHLAQSSVHTYPPLRHELLCALLDRGAIMDATIALPRFQSHAPYLSPLEGRELLERLTINKLDRVTKEHIKELRGFVEATPGLSALDVNLYADTNTAVTLIAGFKKIPTLDTLGVRIRRASHRAAITEWTDATPALPRVRFLERSAWSH